MPFKPLFAYILSLIALLASSGPAMAQDGPKVEIVQPKVGSTLDGTVDVLVKITGAKPATVQVGFKGGPYVAAEKSDDQWKAKVDSTLVPNGEHQFIALTDNKKLKAAVKVKMDNELNVYFADLHSHTGYSDGTLTPAVAHDYARNVAELDVFCLTDHLESVDDLEWLDTRGVALNANEDGAFAVIPGLEWTKKWGHLNIYDPQTRHWPNDPAEFYKAAADAGVTTKFNHPGDGTKSHAGLEYSEIGDKTVQLMEVRRVEEEKAFIRALDKGWHIAPEGSDDTHSANWGNCGRWTGILAPGLSKRNVLDALANRRVYSTLDRNCTLTFHVNGVEMGSILSEPVKEVKVRVQVIDPDEKDVIAKIELFGDGEVVQVYEPNKRGTCWLAGCSPSAGKHYYFAKVTQADGNLLWSAPIWVTVAE